MRDSKEIQEAKVLSYMKAGGRISGLKAFTEFRIMRLPARIWDLKQKGYPIRSEMVYHEDEDGNRTKWKEYWLARA